MTAPRSIFTDEWGGGGRPRCRVQDPQTWGANAIYDIIDGKLVFRSYYKLPAVQTDKENCVAHNGSMIPVPGRDLFVQAWYQGGLSISDFTDSSAPARDRLLRSRAGQRRSRDPGRLLVDLLVSRPDLRH
jgi:hypothetical protein